MKEFKKSNTITYNLMSFTGFKSLMLFTLLLEEARSYQEICEFFRNHEYIKEEISIDTFRVYLTSLKRCGCEIEKYREDGVIKYFIASHPFEFRMSKEQIRSIMKVYRIIIQTMDVKGLFALDVFIRKLADKIQNADLLTAICKNSIFNRIEEELVEKLIDYTQKKYQITFIYNSPKREKVEIEIVADKLGISNGKVYLFGTNVKYQEYSYFQLQRITDIIQVKTNTIDVSNIPIYNIKYELNGLTPDVKLSDDEKIIEINDNSVVVEVTSPNKFMIKQKILSYGPLCKVLEPADFREEIIETLKKMREGYIHG